jgi:head-tail adaptor
MRAGRLRTELAIEQNTATRDAAGGEVASWGAFLATWWCELNQVNGGETYRGRIVHASANHLAIGRYVAGITPAMRATLAGRVFDILRVESIDNRGAELRLHLAERTV